MMSAPGAAMVTAGCANVTPTARQTPRRQTPASRRIRRTYHRRVHPGVRRESVRSIGPGIIRHTIAHRTWIPIVIEGRIADVPHRHALERRPRLDREVTGGRIDEPSWHEDRFMDHVGAHQRWCV